MPRVCGRVKVTIGSRFREQFEKRDRPSIVYKQITQSNGEIFKKNTGEEIRRQKDVKR